MAIDLDLFSGYKFRTTVEKYCEQLEWPTTYLDNSSASLKLRTTSGTIQTVFIVLHGQTFEFSVPSAIKFQSLDEIPGSLSNWLLVLNSKNKIGFWCIEELSNQHVFSVMHNVELSLINIEYFESVISALVQRCDELEQMIAKILEA
jgi:hypothetical protein